MSIKHQKYITESLTTWFAWPRTIVRISRIGCWVSANDKSWLRLVLDDSVPFPFLLRSHRRRNARTHFSTILSDRIPIGPTLPLLQQQGAQSKPQEMLQLLCLIIRTQTKHFWCKSQYSQNVFWNDFIINTNVCLSETQLITDTFWSYQKGCSSDMTWFIFDPLFEKPKCVWEHLFLHFSAVCY